MSRSIILFNKACNTFASGVVLCVGNSSSPILLQIVPIKPEAAGAVLERQEAFRQDIMRAYNEDDLQNYNNTVYKALMAIADAESHKKTLRVTDNAQFQAMSRIMGGMVLLNAAAQEIGKRLGQRIF